jgi:hypothetical protein
MSPVAEGKRRRAGVAAAFRRLAGTLDRAARIAIAGVMVAAAITACGGGGSSKSKSTSSSSTSSSVTNGDHKAKHKGKRPPVPLQQVRVNVQGSALGANANAKPGQVVTILVRVPPADAAKRLTIAIDRTGPKTFVATSSVAGTPLHASGQINESSAGTGIALVHWGCRLPPMTFCPVKVVSSSPSHVKLTVDAPSVPVALTARFAKPGTVPTPRLLALGLPAPGSGIPATVQVTSQNKGSKPAPLSSTTSASPGSLIHVRVQPQPGSPAHATLRIAIPHTSGKSIAIEAGGTAKQPASTATVNGNIRVSGLVYSCGLPPATFCPLSSIKTTSTGLELTLPTPQVPVTLTLLTANA